MRLIGNLEMLVGVIWRNLLSENVSCFFFFFFFLIISLGKFSVKLNDL